MSYTRIPPNGAGDATGIALLFFSIFSLILAAIAIALRVWVRGMKGTPLALQDWLLFLGWFFSLGLTITIIIFVGFGGLGQHQKHVSTDSVILTLQLLPAAESLWTMANTATKVSILLVYKNIFALRKFRILADTVIVIVIMLAVGNIIQCLAICRPFAFQWDKTIEGGVCGNQTLGILLVAFLNLVTDLMIVIMPMPLVWKLKMPRPKRLVLMAIFGLGIIICVITILRIVFTFSLIQNPHDSTYWIAINAIFLTLEPNLGMVNACLLLLKPLLHRLRPKLGWASHTQSSQDYPLGSHTRDRPSKLLPVKYHARHTDGAHKFTRLGDNHHGLEGAALDFVPDGNVNGIENLAFAKQTKEETVGQSLPAKGITVTKTINVESYMNS
ncbi:uncharacterized protein BP5553_00263 [Venustampulla echinocandica]|uniref:Rhodopsin domain-containing protein n=1 Tax=Venustampulla echinocandica TaxID=2656787 RepID=A0A370TXM8_9HELO|nr:uncharacterized protein BP5553_00263 [Venustampulla echinocandica]RDL40284.1 hypothetical protein BP5553_00263 [Venustampulla echinocandica]